LFIDIASYDASKRVIENWLHEREITSYSEACSMLAVFSFVPVIAVAFYVGEIRNWPPEIESIVKRLKDFYGYTEIAGIPKSCPFKI